jgi:hypothetical protein
MPHHTSRFRALRLAGPAAACMLALAACGGAGGAKASPDVASLPTSNTGPAPSSAAGSDATASSGTATGGSAVSTTGRPQERLDDTPQEREALIHAWDECLVEHGAHWAAPREQSGPVNPSGNAGGIRTVADPVPDKAKAACENKLPLEPPELDPSINPHYRDDVLAEITCLRDHGEMVHLTSDTSVDPNGLGWTFDSSNTPLPANSDRIENDCELAAFGGKGK